MYLITLNFKIGGRLDLNQQFYHIVVTSVPISLPPQDLRPGEDLNFHLQGPQRPLRLPISPPRSCILF